MVPLTTKTREQGWTKNSQWYMWNILSFYLFKQSLLNPSFMLGIVVNTGYSVSNTDKSLKFTFY